MHTTKKVRINLFRLFLGESLIGGLTVILPLAIIAFFFGWILQVVAEVVEPIAHLFDTYGLPLILSDVIVIIATLLICASVGHVVRTRLGGWLYRRVERTFFSELPGYQTLKDMVAMLLEKESSPFKGEVAKVWLYGRSVPTWTIGIVTSRHADGTYTTFVPTAPSPASGVVYHLGADQVEICSDISMDQAFKVIVACGAGAGVLFESKLQPTADL